MSCRFKKRLFKVIRVEFPSLEGLGVGCFPSLESLSVGYSLLLCCVLVMNISSCAKSSDNSNSEPILNEIKHANTDQLTHVSNSKSSKISDIPLPNNFERVESQNDFATYLRALPLDTTDNVVHLYNGQQKANQNVHYAIIKMDVGNRDLQQCADAVMRLKAEQLYQAKQYDEITFMFTNGDWVDFNKYAKGFRPSINGNKITWSKTKPESFSYETFRAYMNLVFSYAGTLSLSKQLEKVDDFNDIAVGDVIIIGGSPGHAVIVVDVAIEKSTQKKIFMIAQSYMPAQEIHILKNLENKRLSPWYEIPTGQSIITPEYGFTKDDLMRFSK